MKDTKSLLLVLLSVGLVGTWIYHLYDKTIYSKTIAEVSSKDDEMIQSKLKDSLKLRYVIAINNIDTAAYSANIPADSMGHNTRLDQKFAEIKQLRIDITAILNNSNATGSDLETALRKTILLQQKIKDLQNDKAYMEEEKSRMTKILAQVNNEIDNKEKDLKKLELQNTSLNQEIKKASSFSASQLRLVAISSEGSSEKETTEAKKTGKFLLSFVVQNNIIQDNNAEVYVVVLKPDGNVLQSQQVWESGSFNALNGDKKNYTLKMKFDYNKGEPKQLALTLNADNYQKGNYRMQVYHNGIMIGQAVKKLS